MSWWRWMVSDSNKFVLIRSEGRVSVGKQLVLRTASTYQLLVKAPSWLHWDWLLKWWGCTATTRWSVIVGMQISSINETAVFTYCCIPGVCNLYYWRAWPSAEIFPGAGKVDIFLSFSGCWRCNANGRIQKRKCQMLRQKLHTVLSL